MFMIVSSRSQVSFQGKRSRGRRREQLGMTLLEVLMVLGLLSSIIVGVAKLAEAYSDDTRAALVAQHMSAVGRAAQAYIKDNYAAVAGNATSATPALITVPMLRTAGYLQSGFSITNNYNQSVCVLVLEPTANNLNALVIAEGGTTLDDLTLGGVAAAIGAAGGGVYSTATTTLRGAMGGWSMGTGAFVNANASGQKCDGTGGTPVIAAGHPVQAIWFEGGDVSSGLLHRDAVPGRPELNTMNTPLIMGSVQTSGAACTTTGAIARDSDGGVLSCQGGTWKPGGSAYWKDPVATFASLPASGDPVGAVRMTTDTGRAFMWTGGSWSPLAVDQNGHLTVPGRVTSGEYVQINGVATEGAGCSPNGLVGRNAAGLILSCQTGIWKGPGGSETPGQYAYFHTATCPSGWVPANGSNGTIDLRGEFIRGWDAGRGADPGRGLNTWQNYEIQAHSHSGGVRLFAPKIGQAASSSPNYISSQATGQTGGSETRPRNVALLACMKQ